MHLNAGQKMQVMEYDGRIEMIPEKDISELKGFLKGIDTAFERERDKMNQLSVVTQRSTSSA